MPTATRRLHLSNQGFRRAIIVPDAGNKYYYVAKLENEKYTLVPQYHYTIDYDSYVSDREPKQAQVILIDDDSDVDAYLLEFDTSLSVDTPSFTPYYHHLTTTQTGYIDTTSTQFVLYSDRDKRFVWLPYGNYAWIVSHKFDLKGDIYQSCSVHTTVGGGRITNCETVHTFIQQHGFFLIGNMTLTSLDDNAEDSNTVGAGVVNGRNLYKYIPSPNSVKQTNAYSLYSFVMHPSSWWLWRNPDDYVAETHYVSGQKVLAGLVGNSGENAEYGDIVSVYIIGFPLTYTDGNMLAYTEYIAPTLSNWESGNYQVIEVVDTVLSNSDEVIIVSSLMSNISDTNTQIASTTSSMSDIATQIIKGVMNDGDSIFWIKNNMLAYGDYYAQISTQTQNVSDGLVLINQLTGNEADTIAYLLSGITSKADYLTAISGNVENTGDIKQIIAKSEQGLMDTLLYISANLQQIGDTLVVINQLLNSQSDTVFRITTALTSISDMIFSLKLLVQSLSDVLIDKQSLEVSSENDVLIHIASLTSSLADTVNYVYFIATSISDIVTQISAYIQSHSDVSLGIANNMSNIGDTVLNESNFVIAINDLIASIGQNAIDLQDIVIQIHNMLYGLSDVIIDQFDNQIHSEADAVFSTTSAISNSSDTYIKIQYILQTLSDTVVNIAKTSTTLNDILLFTSKNVDSTFDVSVNIVEYLNNTIDMLVNIIQKVQSLEDVDVDINRLIYTLSFADSFVGIVDKVDVGGDFKVEIRDDVWNINIQKDTDIPNQIPKFFPRPMTLVNQSDWIMDIFNVNMNMQTKGQLLEGLNRITFIDPHTKKVYTYYTTVGGRTVKISDSLPQIKW